MVLRFLTSMDTLVCTMFVGFLHIFGAEFPPIDSLTQVPHRFAGALLMPKQIVLRGQRVFLWKTWRNFPKRQNMPRVGKTRASRKANLGCWR